MILISRRLSVKILGPWDFAALDADEWVLGRGRRGFCRLATGGGVMKPEKVHIGTTVKVRERHRIAERRGMVGRIAAHYGGNGHMAVDVRFSGGHRRLFWPEDLEEISSPRPWWRSLLGRADAE
jgi:hypothetical protein